MTLSERDLERDVSREVARVRQEPVAVRQRGPRGRPCRVCQDPDARRIVNNLLGVGMGPTEIVRHLEAINTKRRKNDQIGYWSVREHRINHFNVQEPQKAALLRVLESEFERENSEAMADAVGNFLTLRGMLKIISQKGMEDLLSDNKTVGFTTGLDALRELEELEKSDRDQAERAALRRDVNLIQQAIREEFSEDEMRRLTRRIDILRGVTSEDDEDEDVVDVEVVDDDDDEYDDDVADFTMESDDEDPLED